MHAVRAHELLLLLKARAHAGILELEKMEKKKTCEAVLKVDSTVHHVRQNIIRKLDDAIGSPEAMLQRAPTTIGGALSEFRSTHF